MKRRIIVFAVVMCAIAPMCFIGFESIAATGNQAYAVYRKGDFPNIWGHAGLMDEPHSTNTLPVIHITGGETVGFVSWSGFLSGQPYVCVYRPNGSMTSAQRDNVKNMARLLKTTGVSYALLSQIDYMSSVYSGTWVNYADIV